MTKTISGLNWHMTIKKRMGQNVLSWMANQVNEGQPLAAQNPSARSSAEPRMSENSTPMT